MKTPTTLALAASLALVAGVSFAQQPPPPGQGPGERYGERMRPDPAQIAERRAQRLRDTLQLRPDQEPALRAFLDASRPSGDRMGRRHDRGEAQAPLTTPQRLDRMHERLAERMANFERRAAATKRFYAALSPAQQRAFDALPRDGGRRGGRGGPGGHHGGHHGGPRG
jgi:hypothetical protein